MYHAAQSASFNVHIQLYIHLHFLPRRYMEGIYSFILPSALCLWSMILYQKNVIFISRPFVFLLYMEYNQMKGGGIFHKIKWWFHKIKWNLIWISHFILCILFYAYLERYDESVRNCLKTMFDLLLEDF